MMKVATSNATTNYYQQQDNSVGVSVSYALLAIKTNPRATFNILDTATNIEKNINVLTKIANNIKTVTFKDTEPQTININSTAYLSQGGKLLTKKMVMGGDNNQVSLNVSNVLVKDVGLVSSDVNVSRYSVSDLATNISLDINTLNNGISNLGDIKVTGSAVPIKLSYDQYTNTKNTVLDKIVGNFTLNVYGANTTEALGLGSETHIKSVSIVDHAQAIADNLDALEAMGLKINEIKSDDTNVFNVSSSQLGNDAKVIGKLYKGYQLNVYDAKSTDAQSLVKNKKIISLDIADTAENISAHLVLLNKLGAQVHTVKLIDNEPLTLSTANFLKYQNILNKIIDPSSTDAPNVTPITDVNDANYNNNYQLNITEASAADAEALKDNLHIVSISVSDNSSDIAANLDNLNANDLVKEITQNNDIRSLEITAYQLLNDTKALALISNKENFSLRISGVSASDAKDVLNDTKYNITSVAVSDTGSAILSNLESLKELGSNLTEIIQKDNTAPLELTAEDWLKNLDVLSKIKDSYNINLTEVSAAKAAGLAQDPHVQSIKVSDTGDEISRNLGALKNLGATLSSITQSDSTAIKITGSQYVAYSSTLNKLGQTYTLSVSEAYASQIQSLAADVDHVHDIQVSDTAGNIATNLSSLQDAAANANGPTISASIKGIPSPFTLSKTRFDQYKDGLNAIQSNYKLNITGVSASDATEIAANTHVMSMVVKDDSSEFSNVDRLSQLRLIGNKLSSLQQNDLGTSLKLTVSDWASNIVLLSKLKGYSVSLSNVKAASASNLIKNNIQVKSVSISDTASQISLNFDKIASLGSSVQELTFKDAGHLQLSMKQWKATTPTLRKIPGDYTIDITGATAKEAGTLANNDAIGSIGIVDNTDGISSNLDDFLQNQKISSVNLSSAQKPIALSMAQLISDKSGNNVLNKIQGGYSLFVTSTNIADIDKIISNGHVVSAEIEGTATQIRDALPNLMQAGKGLKSLTLTEPNSTMNIDYEIFKQYKSTLSMINQPFNVALNNIAASSAILESQNSPFNMNFNIRDNADQISINLDNLSGLGNKLTGISTIEQSPILKIGSRQYLSDVDTLNKINVSGDAANYQLDLSGGDLNLARNLLSNTSAAAHINGIAVIDNADNISNNFDFLQNVKIKSVKVLPDSPLLNITGAQYNSAASIAKLNGPYSLTVNAASPTLASTLQSDNRVGSFSVAASALDIGNKLPDLLALSHLDHIDITAVNGAMTLTAEQMLEAQDSLEKIRGDYSLKLTNVAMSNLGQFDSMSHVSSINISDTSEAIASKWNDLIQLGSQLTNIEVTTQNPLAITLDQWNQSSGVISKLSNGKNFALLDVSPDQATIAAALNDVSTVSIKGTANQVSAKFDALVQLGDKLDEIEITDNQGLMLTQNQIDAGISTLEKIKGGYEVINTSLA